MNQMQWWGFPALHFDFGADAPSSTFQGIISK
jgi:hypothetical protein